MLIKIVFNRKTFCVLKKILDGYKCFSKNCVTVANNVNQNYSDKMKRQRFKKSDYGYIVDPNSADLIASYLSKGWNNGIILEANPGPGVLSRYILKNGVKSLLVFEKNKLFFPALEALKSNYSNLEIYEEDLMLLPVFESKTFSELQHFESLFQILPEYEWIDGVPLRVFSIILNKRNIKFLRFLLAVLPTRSSIFAFGRCEFFLLITEIEFMNITAVPKENFSVYRWSTVLYNLFFEIKCLEKFSSEILFPVNSPYYRKKINSGNDNMYLIQLTPKQNLFSNIVHQNKLADFYFFVRHHFVKRKALVIPTLECWVPSCGPRLIKEGMNVFTKFGDLSPNQILLLFNQFSSWPEYEDSAFQAAASKFYGREHLYEDEIKEQENVDH